MSSLDQSTLSHTKLVRDAAQAARDAVQNLSLAAVDANGQALPAEDAFHLLVDVQQMLSSLRTMTQALPDGVARWCEHEESLGFWREPLANHSNPERQFGEVSKALQYLGITLHWAAEAAENAQSTVNWGYWDENPAD